MIYRNKKLILSLAIFSLINGCAIHGQPSKLAMDLPVAWQENFTPGQVLSENWWSAFGSNELNQLIELSLADSPDMAIAIQRVRQAEATVRGAGASLFPAINLGGGTSRQRSEGKGESASISSSTSVSLGISYEVDLWGRINADLRASRASLASTRYDLQTARLTLVSGVASAYFQVLSARARLAIANDNLAIAERLLRIVDARYRNGVVSALDLSRQQTAVLTQRSTLLPLEVQVRQTTTALAILTGKVPQNFKVANEDLQRFSIPSITPGLPGEILTRRPDLASTEAQLVAADANLDAARAALLPGLQLSGSGGLASSAFLALTDPIKSLSLAGSISQTIFDAGRLRSQVDISDSQRIQLLENYRKVILTALKEVEDALSNVNRYRDEEIAQLAIRDEAQRSLNLAEFRYKEGADDLSTVLDAQRTLYSSQDQLAQVRLARLTAVIDLAKALGGGWEMASIND